MTCNGTSSVVVSFAGREVCATAGVQQPATELSNNAKPQTLADFVHIFNSHPKPAESVFEQLEAKSYEGGRRCTIMQSG